MWSVFVSRGLPRYARNDVIFYFPRCLKSLTSDSGALFHNRKV